MKGAFLTVICIIIFSCQAEKEVKYFPSGQLMSVIEMRNGEYDGVQKQYYESGILRGEYQWKGGNLLGNFYEYYPSGQLMKTGFIDQYRYKKANTLIRNILYMRVYNENGERDSVVYPIVGIVKGDTVKFGAENIFGAKLFNHLDSTYSDLSMIITSELSLNSNNLFKDTLADVRPTEDLYFEYNFIAAKVGENQINGAFIFLKELENGYFDRTIQAFTYKYFCVP